MFIITSSAQILVQLISNVYLFLYIYDFRTLQDECKDSCIYEEDIQILRVNGEKHLHHIYRGDRPVFICEKTVNSALLERFPINPPYLLSIFALFVLYYSTVFPLDNQFTQSF